MNRFTRLRGECHVIRLHPLTHPQFGRQCIYPRRTFEYLDLRIEVAVLLAQQSQFAVQLLLLPGERSQHGVLTNMSDPEQHA